MKLQASRSTGTVFAPYVLVAPVVLFLIVFSYLPLPYAFYLAVSRTVPGTGTYEFAGLDNFVRLLTNPDFYESLAVTMKYGISATAVLLVLGVALAVLLNRRMRFREVHMAILVMPWVVSEVVAGFTWVWLLNENFGLLNHMFAPLGIMPSVLLTEPSIAFLSVTLLTVWQRIPYSTLLILAALQNISSEVMEATEIDGATRWQAFWKVVLPQLGATISLVGLLVFIWCMNQTGAILVMTNGGPLRATETLTVFMYKQAFQNFRFPQAASLAVVIAVINIAVGAGYFTYSRRRTER